MLHLAALVLLGLATPGPSDDLAAIVERLGVPDPGTRRLAQRDLALVLDGTNEVRELDAVLVDASAESRRRVARVLGRESRLLGLAASLAASEVGASARVGREALEAQLSRWSKSVFDEPEVAVFDPARQSLPLPSAWVDGTSLPLALDPVSGGLVGAFDRLDRFGGGPAPIVLDPRVVARAVRRPVPTLDATRLEGSWSELLESLCRVHGVAFQLQGYRYPGETRPSDAAEEEGGQNADRPPARPFIHVVPAGTTELAPVGVDLRARAAAEIIRWCRDLARDGDTVRQRAAAVALGTLDWPAAVQWLELRWLEQGDVAALEGLIGAAARGRVAPSLQRPDVLQSIIAIVDDAGAEVQRLTEVRAAAIAPPTVNAAEKELRAAVAVLDGRAQRFASGLAGIAPVVVSAEGGGRSLVGTVLDGFDTAPPTGRWLRLAIIEGLGLEDGDAARAARRALLGEVDARSRRQALRTLLVTGRPGETIRIDDLPALLSESARGAFGIGLELGLAGALPQEGAFDASVLGDDQAIAETVVWAALVDSPDRDVAPWMVAVLEAAARRSGGAIDPLERAAWEARGDTGRAIGALLARASEMLSAGDRRALDESALRVGLAGTRARSEAFAAARTTLAGSSGDPDAEAVERAWLSLAALVDDPRHGSESLALLEDVLVRTLLGEAGVETMGSSSALIEATELTCKALRRTRREVREEQFLDALRDAAGPRSHPLFKRIYSFEGDWPPPAPLPPRDLERLEPVLPAR